VIALILLCIPPHCSGGLRAAGQHNQSLAQKLHRPTALSGLSTSRFPVTWFQLSIPYDLCVYAARRHLWRGRPHEARALDVTKMALGDSCSASLSHHGQRYLSGRARSWIRHALIFVVITLGEFTCHRSPCARCRVAPPQILSMMMGYGSSPASREIFLQGYIGSFFSAMDKTHFFCSALRLAVLRARLPGCSTGRCGRCSRSRTDAAVVVTAEPQAEPHLEPHPGE